MKNILISIGLFISITTFSQLDTVNNGSFSGAGDGEVLYTAFQKVNLAIKAINTGSITGNFPDLNDVPGSYSGLAGYYVKVNSGEDSLLFTAPFSFGNGLTLTGATVEFGGTLTKQTLFDLNGFLLNIDGLTGNVLFGGSAGINTFGVYPNILDIAAIVSLDLGLNTGSGGGTLEFDAADNVFRDEKSPGSQSGLKYAADYQDLEPLSLTHKAHVDAAIDLAAGDTISLVDIIYDSTKYNAVIKDNHTEGLEFYDDETKSLIFLNDIPNFRHNIGYELVARVYNSTGEAISDGTVVRLVGNYKDNGRITPLIRKAGISSPDSTLVLGMATVDIPDTSYGIILLKGEAKGLNTSACANDSCAIFLNFAGTWADTGVAPPYFHVPLGQVYYADADSGRIFFSPTLPSYNPSPHISGDTTRYSLVLDLTQNIYTDIPIGNFSTEDEWGYTLIGDSIRCDVAGHITIAFNMSYIGNASSDVWRMGIFNNATELHTVSRSTSSTAVGNSTAVKTTTVAVGDYITFRMTNESASRDPTLEDIAYEMIYLHE